MKPGPEQLNKNPDNNLGPGRKFLFNKTKTGTGTPRLTKPRPVGIRELKQEFPQILIGRDFIDYAVSSLDSSLKFGVMLVRIDDFRGIEEISGIPYAVSVLIDTARSIQTGLEQSSGMWGLIERDMFGCFFPEKDENKCRPYAEKIQKTLAKWRKQTLSIGIAIYPVAQFTRIQTIRNARKALDHAALSGPDSIAAFNAVSLNICGDKYFQDGDIHSAISEFKKAILIDPSNINIHNSLGVCYSSLAAYKSAIIEFETAAMLGPDEVMPVYNIGLVHMQINDNEKALEFFLKADKMKHPLFEPAFQAARLYYKTGNIDKAELYFRRAAELKPNSASAVRFLAECLVSANKLHEAVEVYKKVVKLNPNDASALSAMGNLYYILDENIEIAITFCKHSIEIAPDNGLFHRRLGKLYSKQSLFDDALNEFKIAADLGYDCTQYINEILSPD